MKTIKQGLLTATWESYGTTLLELEASFVLPRSGALFELSMFFLLKETPEKTAAQAPRGCSIVW